MRRQLLKRMALVFSLLALPAFGGAAFAANPDGIGYRQRPGARLPLEAALRDENGRTIRLSELFDGRPLILLLGYFHCPKLCSVARSVLLSSLHDAGLIAGRDYTLAAVSIDPAEEFAAAAGAKEADVARLAAPGEERHWRYLTGDPTAVRLLETAVGYEDRVDEARGSFAHPLGVVFVTPQGVVSSYLLDLAYNAGDVRRAIARASSGDVAAPVSPILSLCFDYDPMTGRYTPAIMRLLRWGVGATIIFLSATAIWAFRKEIRRAWRERLSSG